MRSSVAKPYNMDLNFKNDELRRVLLQGASRLAKVAMNFLDKNTSGFMLPSSLLLACSIVVFS